MKQNKYDEEAFFLKYIKMERSVKGLEAAGEWHIFKELLPDFKGKHVLDLGCGFGWHCRYAREQKARSVIGVDISEKMLQQARKMTNDPAVSYIKTPIEDMDFAEAQFDVGISSLALHYIKPYETICQKVYKYLKPGGIFVFSVEHPIFTSREEQDWHYDEKGNRLHWAVDHYQMEGKRDTSFLTENVTKYHRTFSTYMNGLLAAGFTINQVREPIPPEEMLTRNPELKDELRRPMFLLISARK